MKRYLGDLINFSFPEMSGVRTRFQRLENKLKVKNSKANIDESSQKFGCGREKGKMTAVACGRQKFKEGFCLILSASFLR